MNNRNMPCYCGSGLKYKHCCWSKHNSFPELESKHFKREHKKSVAWVAKKYKEMTSD